MQSQLSEIISKDSVDIKLNEMYIGDSGCEQLSQQLKKNKQIMQLELCGNNISGSGMGALMDGLQYNSCISKINLQWNNVGSNNVGISKLVELVRDNNSLVEVDLRNNQIKDESISQIVEILELNKIQVLNLEWNQLSETSLNLLISSLQSKPSKTRLHLSGNPLPQNKLLIFDKLQLANISHKENTNINHKENKQLHHNSNQQQSQQDYRVNEELERRSNEKEIIRLQQLVEILQIELFHTKSEKDDLLNEVDLLQYQVHQSNIQFMSSNNNAHMQCACLQEGGALSAQNDESHFQQQQQQQQQEIIAMRCANQQQKESIQQLEDQVQRMQLEREQVYKEIEQRHLDNHQGHFDQQLQSLITRIQDLEAQRQQELNINKNELNRLNLENDQNYQLYLQFQQQVQLQLITIEEQQQQLQDKEELLQDQFDQNNKTQKLIKKMEEQLNQLNVSLDLEIQSKIKQHTKHSEDLLQLQQDTLQHRSASLLQIKQLDNHIHTLHQDNLILRQDYHKLQASLLNQINLTLIDTFTNIHS